MRHRLKLNLQDRMSSPCVSPPVSVAKRETELAARSTPQSPVFHPHLFENLQVELYFDNPEEYKRAQENLELFGAIIISDPTGNIVPDIIVSESAPEKCARTIEAARAKYMKRIHERKVPKVVLENQIPWIFWSPKRLESIREARGHKIVVADVGEKYRPAYKVLVDPVTLHFGTVPRGYVVTPFNPIIEVPVERKRETPTVACASPSAHGFCEICKVSFGNPEEHHTSKGHMARVAGDDMWSPLDALITQVMALRRL